MRFLLFTITVIVIIGCNTSPDFRINHISIDIEEEIKTVALHNNDIVCYTYGNRFVVIDHSYKRKVTVEKQLNKLKIDNLYKRNDTLWLLKNSKDESEENWLCLTTDYSVIHVDTPYFLKKTEIPIIETLFQDNDFIVYAGCVGEFGGTVFFYDRKSGITYSHPCTCPKQVLYSNGSYYVISALSHIVEHSYIIRISNPRKLFITPQYEFFNHNWWAGVDSIYKSAYDKEYNHVGLNGAKIYGDTLGGLIALNYGYMGNLYSILTEDSTYTIMKHENDSLVSVESFSFCYQSDFAKDFQMDNDRYLGFSAIGNGGQCEESKINQVMFIAQQNKIDIIKLY